MHKMFFFLCLSMFGAVRAGDASLSVAEKMRIAQSAVDSLQKGPMPYKNYVTSVVNQHRAYLAECMLHMALEPGQHPAVVAKAICGVVSAECAGLLKVSEDDAAMLVDVLLTAAHRANKPNKRMVDPFLCVEAVAAQHPQDSTVSQFLQFALHEQPVRCAPIIHGVNVVSREMRMPTDRYGYEVGRDGVASLVMCSPYAQKK